MEIRDLKNKVSKIKYECLKLCIDAGQGHVTSAFSCAEIVVALYYEIMKYDTANRNYDDRDRFIMSKNHGSVITYPILRDLGFIDKDKEIDFLKNGSFFGGHSKSILNGVEFSGGSLGIGLGVGCGMAYHLKLKKSESRVFVLLGDGECYEGSIWESLMFAGSNELENLVIIIDRNKMAITDFTENMLRLEPLRSKLESFNLDVEVVDGHNLEELIRVLRKRAEKRPRCIICDTIKGNGISSMSGKMFKHGIAPAGEEALVALREVGENYGS